MVTKSIDFARVLVLLPALFLISLAQYPTNPTLTGSGNNCLPTVSPSNGANGGATGNSLFIGSSNSASGGSYAMPSLHFPIPNCQVHTSPDMITCAICYDGFQLTADSTGCTEVLYNGPLGGRTQGPPPDPCPGQYSSMNRCWDYGPNCDLYDSCGNCLSCRSGLDVINGKCQPKSSSFSTCQSYSNGVCITCNYGATMLRKGYCQQEQPNCRNFDRQGACTQCLQGFILKGNWCMSMSKMVFSYSEPNCYAWQSGSCVRCQLSWQLSSKSGKTCEPYIPSPYQPTTTLSVNIKSVQVPAASDPYGALSRSAGLVGGSGSQGTSPPPFQGSSTGVSNKFRMPIPYCRVHTTSDYITCELCYDGYDLEPDKQTCTPVPYNGSMGGRFRQPCSETQYYSADVCYDNCLSYDIYRNCAQCRKGTYPLNGKCVATPPPKPVPAISNGDLIGGVVFNSKIPNYNGIGGGSIQPPSGITVGYPVTGAGLGSAGFGTFTDLTRNAGVGGIGSMGGIGQTTGGIGGAGLGTGVGAGAGAGTGIGGSVTSTSAYPAAPGRFGTSSSLSTSSFLYGKGTPTITTGK